MSFSTGPQGPAPHYSDDWTVDVSKKNPRPATPHESLQKALNDLRNQPSTEPQGLPGEVLKAVEAIVEAAVARQRETSDLEAKALREELTAAEETAESLRTELAATQAEVARLRDREVRIENLDVLEAKTKQAFDEAEQARAESFRTLRKLRDQL